MLQKADRTSHLYTWTIIFHCLLFIKTNILSPKERHILLGLPRRKRLHLKLTKENIALRGPPQHLSVWKDNLKRLPTDYLLFVKRKTKVMIGNQFENRCCSYQVRDRKNLCFEDFPIFISQGLQQGVLLKRKLARDCI